MPALMGIVADKWINAERLYGLLEHRRRDHAVPDPARGRPSTMFPVRSPPCVFYMPTIALAITTVSYNALKNEGMDVVATYPPIRVGVRSASSPRPGTTSLSGLETSSGSSTSPLPHRWRWAVRVHPAAVPAEAGRRA